MLRNYNARAENGRVAQMVEQLTFNQLVAGSIPAAVTLLESFVVNSYRGFVVLRGILLNVKIYLWGIFVPICHKLDRKIGSRIGFISVGIRSAYLLLSKGFCRLRKLRALDRKEF